jgi:hypothetical protein
MERRESKSIFQKMEPISYLMFLPERISPVAPEVLSAGLLSAGALGGVGGVW